jgi:hypothetical protein
MISPAFRPWGRVPAESAPRSSSPTSATDAGRQRPFRRDEAHSKASAGARIPTFFHRQPDALGRHGCRQLRHIHQASYHLE